MPQIVYICQELTITENTDAACNARCTNSCFYETFGSLSSNINFVPLGKRTKSNPAIGVIWHEVIAGRNAEYVASAFGQNSHR